MNNPIIEEVRAARESLAAKFDFNLHRIVVDAIKRQGNQRTVNRQNGMNKTKLPTGEAAAITRSVTT
ncbi:MAG: hypothetical protein WEB60_12980 [Terrimicrobiaceae bacterium]